MIRRAPFLILLRFCRMGKMACSGYPPFQGRIVLSEMPAHRLAALIRSKEVSALEVAESFIDNIEASDSRICAFLYTDFSYTRDVARRVDEELKSATKLSPLAGVPIAVKDMILTRDMPTTAGSKILEGWIPPYNATVIERISRARMPILGKTNQDEFGMGSSTEYSAYKTTRNPWDLSRTAGGSGGGSSAAVSASQAPLALGTDTGGSIRLPAHCTGTVGIRPTYGSVSRYGVIALASSFDQVGPCSSNILDAALLHEVIAGYDPADAVSIKDQDLNFSQAAYEGANRGISGVRLGFVNPSNWCNSKITDLFGRTLKSLESEGAVLHEVQFPNFDHAVQAYYLIMQAEASSNLSRYDSIRFGPQEMAASASGTVSKTRSIRFGPEVKRRILLGTHILSAGYYDDFYMSAQKIRSLVKRDFAKIFSLVDVLLLPTAPTPAFKLGEKIDHHTSMYKSDTATTPASLAGLPAGSIPMGVIDGLPVGLQIIAPGQFDSRVYSTGAAIEQIIGDIHAMKNTKHNTGQTA
ncbi:Asp-tRNA(Asn)/Glu-tRNA(Gln) amidotransferase subunit GatA [Tropheryma whipplei]|uniref:Glutamyl-tRNA(Gln) amidotransferase subunit A n=2 Tax=Tropheryma whipplei TaxID=2039 RepID=GATA_TROW8|nr:RecName: Full=Glutamyl-tRNA(Gln) amidotransferase subunit A; Short=Glu-ADT subunit A [Tropheryma whipplei TW08/27]